MEPVTEDRECNVCYGYNEGVEVTQIAEGCGTFVCVDCGSENVFFEDDGWF